MVHTGRMIREEMERQQRSVAWLARRLGCGRAGVYRIYERNYVSTDVLWEISRALNCNFFALLSDAYREENTCLSQY